MEPIAKLLEVMENFRKHQVDLPDTPDQILLILKGHLLVEQEINRILEAKVPNPDALKLREKYGPKFVHRLSLLRALMPEIEYCPKLWDIIDKLNTLRNEFAHKLNPEDVTKRIDQFTNDVYEASGLMENSAFREKVGMKDQRDRVQQSILFIMYRLAGLTIS